MVKKTKTINKDMNRQMLILIGVVIIILSLFIFLPMFQAFKIPQSDILSIFVGFLGIFVIGASVFILSWILYWSEGEYLKLFKELM
ncbi:hypothetical protein ACFL5G_03895 [Candidatus Margulisiibacteriota bacterium]